MGRPMSGTCTGRLGEGKRRVGGSIIILLKGCNLDITRQFLKLELRTIQKSFEDCRNREGCAD